MGLPDRAMDRLLHLPAATTRRYTVTRDLRVPMPDGVALLADRYRPAGDEGPLPVVLVRTPYGRASLSGRVYGAAPARRGFQVLLQSVRGTSGSGGRFAGPRRERADGLATVAWLREQPWCDGRVAMAGGSYLGYAQWAVAPYVEPPLAAVCPGVTSAGVNGQLFPGGSLALRSVLGWAARVDAGPSGRLGGFLPDRARARRLAAAVTTLPLRDADIAATGHELAVWRDIVTHADPATQATHWAGADHRTAVANVRAPVSMVTGWRDPYLPWQLSDFRTAAESGVPARITIGPWGHGDLTTTSTMLIDQLDWLGAHLLGRPANRVGPVHVFLPGADTWLDLPAWPPADSVDTPVYLGPAGTLAVQPAPGGAPDRFTHDPADPVPDPPEHDARDVEARQDVLVFTGPPIDADLDVLGDVRAVLPIRTDPAHADVLVRLCDVHEDGRSVTVSDGLVRLSPGHAGPVVVPMRPAGHRFLAGHRLRVHVTGGAFPRYARNPGTGEPLADAVRMVPCRYELAHDPVRPGRVELPVRGGVTPW